MSTSEYRPEISTKNHQHITQGILHLEKLSKIPPGIQPKNP